MPKWMRGLWGLLLLAMLLAASPFVQAHDPPGTAASARTPLPTPRQEPYLAAGESGPYLGPDELGTYRIRMARDTLPIQHAPQMVIQEGGPAFTLDDLRTYTPPPKPRFRPLRPPKYMAYPAEVDEVPIVPRQYSTPTISYLAGHEILHGGRQMPAVALTFDCESGTGSVRKMLETLRQEEVQATFFILGKYAYMFPDIIHEIHAGGHELGNHSFFHPLWSDIGPITATQEVLYTEAVIDWAVGEHVPMRYFRFPYGGRGYDSLLQVAALGYQSAFWDIDPRGWDPETSPADVVEHVRRTAHYGGIVIMHCGSWDDAHALADVIRVLREMGIAPGTLSDVLTTQDRDVPDYPPP